jgi:hypothetical protein
MDTLKAPDVLNTVEILIIIDLYIKVFKGIKIDTTILVFLDIRYAA